MHCPSKHLLDQSQQVKRLSVRRSNVFIVNSENNLHHFLPFLLLTIIGKTFIGIASSDYDTISIYTMHNKLLQRFLSNNKALLSSTRTSYINGKKISIGMFKKEAIFCYI